MSDPVLSIVVPLFDEEQVVEELAARCEQAATSTGVAFEIVFADDASRDRTGALASAMTAAGRPVRHVRLEGNRGQFGATQAGLAAARGAWVVVLDGDLQDPPEVIPRLYESVTREDAAAGLAVAVKTRRDDPPWFTIGRLGYQALQAMFSRVAVPSGAGSYCIMPLAVARRIASLPAQPSNLIAVLSALEYRPSTVPYEKAARYDGRSRVGAIGLAREAASSLVLTGALARAALVLSAPLFIWAAVVFADSARADAGSWPFAAGLASLVAMRAFNAKRAALLALGEGRHATADKDQWPRSAST